MADTSDGAMHDRLFLAAIVAAFLIWLVVFSVFETGFHWWSWPTVLWGIVFYPIVEEVVFRGLLQGLLTKRFPSRALMTPANLITTLIFTTVHVAAKGLSLINGLVFIPSLVFGFFRDRTGNVGRSIILHSYYNAGFFLLFPTSFG